MIEGDAEVQKVLPQVESTVERAEVIKNEIIENFQNRQKTVWQLIHSHVSTKYVIRRRDEVEMSYLNTSTLSVEQCCQIPRLCSF